jgi:hypothetical protein
MNHEIHMYSAVALATATSGYPEGQRHPLLIFLRQEAHSEHDLLRAESAAVGLGWDEVDITRAGTLPPDAGATMNEPVHSAYVAAVEGGQGVLAFPDVVKAAPRKG